VKSQRSRRGVGRRRTVDEPRYRFGISHYDGIEQELAAI
jgi:hypothetical protein